MQIELINPFMVNLKYMLIYLRKYDKVRPTPFFFSIYYFFLLKSSLLRFKFCTICIHLQCTSH